MIEDNFGLLFSPAQLDAKVYDNAVILPHKLVDFGNTMGGGIMTESGDHISVIDVGESRYLYEQEEVKCDEGYVVYLGMFHTVWGHCITDDLKKIWFLSSSEYNELQKNQNVRLVYTGFDGFEPTGHFNDNFKELLNKLGVDFNTLERVEEPTRFKRIYVPSDSLIYNRTKEIEPFNCSVARFWTNEFKRVFDRLIAGTERVEGFEKVYLSRKNWQSRDYGEKDIEDLFKKLGFKIVCPEKYSFSQQLSIFVSCKCMASTESSITHNSIFMQDGSELIIIRKGNYVNSYQSAINDMKKMKVTYFDSHLSVFNDIEYPYAGPFFLYVNDDLQKWAYTQTDKRQYLNSFRFERFMNYAEASFLSDMSCRRNGDLFLFEKLKEEILNEKRHKYYKIANRFFPRLFPWKL